MALKKAAGNRYPELTIEKQGQWVESFCFIQAADTQYGLIDAWANVPEIDIKWDEEIALASKAIACANKLSPRPKFFIVCGDLVDALPGTMHYEAQIRDLKKSFEDLSPEIPMVCVCGNHDVGNAPTKESLRSYRDKFGDDYFTFWVGGAFFIVLNSQYHVDSSLVPEEFECYEKWLDEQLEIAKSGRCNQAIVFQHVPWFLHNAREADEYFNIKINERLRMLKKLRDSGIKTIFSGHYHRNAGGWDGDLELVVTSAIGCQIGNDKSGMRIVRVFQNSLDHKYYSFEDFPSTISLIKEEYLP